MQSVRLDHRMERTRHRAQRSFGPRRFWSGVIEACATLGGIGSGARALIGPLQATARRAPTPVIVERPDGGTLEAQSRGPKGGVVYVNKVGRNLLDDLREAGLHDTVAPSLRQIRADPVVHDACDAGTVQAAVLRVARCARRGQDVSGPAQIALRAHQTSGGALCSGGLSGGKAVNQVKDGRHG